MIRSACAADLDQIESIENKSFAAPWSRASIEAELYKDYSRFFVYQDGDEVAGYIIIWDLQHEWEVVTLAVAERFRRRGIADVLLKYALSLSHACAEWRLEVACNNCAAVCLYEKHGFKNRGIIRDYYGQGQDAYRMLRNGSFLRGGTYMIPEHDDLVKELYNTNEEFQRLFDEHIRFEQDLEALYSLKFFPPEVEYNIKNIKRLKLQGKDRMTRIIEDYKLKRNV